MDNVYELYRVEGVPTLQNRVYDTFLEALNSPTGNITLVQDPVSGLVYNKDFDPNAVIYDRNYNNEQAISDVFKLHLEGVANIVIRNLGKKKIVEIGCGKGFFLELMLEKGFDITGYDPSYTGENPRIEKKFYDATIRNNAKGIILRHVLEHIASPWEFLHTIKSANGGQGLIYIEVPCLDWIIKHNAWFDIFYEHVNYFRMADFENIFSHIRDSGKLFSGQYLYIVADLADLRQAPKKDINPVVFPKSFSFNIEGVDANSYINNENKAVVWGASSKGVIFSLMKKHQKNISFAVDINPAKQGKYLPVTGLLVLSPQQFMEEFPEISEVYVMNSNYLDEVRKMTGYKYTYIDIDNKRS
ncbi:class I SAM-dependent methyltransferase [Vreelandella lionensis]|uniref:Class I SAM-dependent methyltransferase n=1 Tax=Vreelandella lionensis TaxID=1144478 RepID=A0ABW8BWU1_9GAMM